MDTEIILQDLRIANVHVEVSVVGNDLVITKSLRGRKFRIEKSIWYMKSIFRDYILFKRCFFLF